MRGAFNEWAGRYAAVGIGTFPIAGKRPLVRQPNTIGCRAAVTLSNHPRFATADIGMWCGAASGLTVVDIDEPGDAALREALKAFGDTPVLVRTHSGKHHAYYRHQGERRRIRFDGRAKIDILGEGGFVVLPPSRGDKGTYEFLSGGLDALRERAALPTINKNAIASVAGQETRPCLETGDIGHRDRELFRDCRRFAAAANSLSELEKYAIDRNARFQPPLPEAQARAKAVQAWKYRQSGRLLVPGDEPTALIRRSEAQRLASNPVALCLLTLLRANHKPFGTFAIALKPMAQIMKVGDRKVGSAIERLIEGSIIERVHVGGSAPGDASQYRFSRLCSGTSSDDDEYNRHPAVAAPASICTKDTPDE